MIEKRDLQIWFTMSEGAWWLRYMVAEGTWWLKVYGG